MKEIFSEQIIKAYQFQGIGISLGSAMIGSEVIPDAKVNLSLKC